MFAPARNAPAETENNRPSPQPNKEPGETSSVTEDDNDSEDDSDSREAQCRCSHCFTTSTLFLNCSFILKVQLISRSFIYFEYVLLCHGFKKLKRIIFPPDGTTIH